MYIGTTEIQIRTLTDVDLFSQFQWLLYKVANWGFRIDTDTSLDQLKVPIAEHNNYRGKKVISVWLQWLEIYIA